jgi:hypothetical protein
MSDAFVPVYDRDLVLVKGKGAKLFDKDGRTWPESTASATATGRSWPRSRSRRDC